MKIIIFPQVKSGKPTKTSNIQSKKQGPIIPQLSGFPPVLATFFQPPAVRAVNDVDQGIRVLEVVAPVGSDLPGRANGTNGATGASGENQEE